MPTITFSLKNIILQKYSEFFAEKMQNHTISEKNYGKLMELYQRWLCDHNDTGRSWCNYNFGDQVVQIAGHKEGRGIEET